jgi:hypothetical protein
MILAALHREIAISIGVDGEGGALVLCLVVFAVQALRGLAQAWTTWVQGAYGSRGCGEQPSPSMLRESEVVCRREAPTRPAIASATPAFKNARTAAGVLVLCLAVYWRGLER